MHRKGEKVQHNYYRKTNVYVLADAVTAAFFEAAGANYIAAESVEPDSFLEFLKAVGCELLLVTEDNWHAFKEHLTGENAPTVMIIPSYKTGETDMRVRIKELSEKAVGLDILTMLEETEVEKDG